MYVKDVLFGFFGFWFFIGPVVYKSYFNKKKLQSYEVEDSYVSMLKDNIKLKQDETNPAQESQQKITF